MTTSHVRAGLRCAVAVLTLAMYGCGGGSPTDDGGGGGGGGGGGNPVMTNQVNVNSDSFNPAAIQVSPGTTVTWTWVSSGLEHNVTFDSNLITDSPTQASGNFQTAMPTQAGTYTYECTIHGFTGSVLVQ
jgi:plastocyanin